MMDLVVASEQQPELDVNDIKLRETFAEMFCYYGNAMEAVISMGIAQPFAKAWGDKFLSEDITHQLIRKRYDHLTSLDGLTERANLCVSKLMRLGDYDGEGFSHSARVAAWTNVAKITLEQAQVAALAEQGGGALGGVMVVPALLDADEWGTFSEKSQDELQKAVRI